MRFLLSSVMLAVATRDIHRVRTVALPLLFALLVPGVSAQDELALPDFGDSAGGLISPQQERALGEEFMRQVRREAPLVTDPEVEDYIQRLGIKLAKGAGYDHDPLLFVINNSEINAFAVPGGFVGVHTGLILGSATESEVAAVLAHEMVHLTQRHTVRGIEAQGRSAIPALLAMLGAIAIAAANPDAGQAALIGVSAAQQQMLLNYSRAYEQEADRIGIQVLANSGFNPQAMPAFFDKMYRATRYDDPKQVPEYLRTHPVTINRIAEARDRADRLPERADPPDSGYAFTQARLVVLTARTPLDAKQYFEPRLQEGTPFDKTVAHYGYALALAAANEFDRAREQMRLVREQDPSNPLLLLATGEIEARAGATAEAVEWYRRALANAPDSRPALYRYTEILSDSGDAESAIRILRDSVLAMQREPRYFRILAQAEGRRGHLAEARIAQAEFYYLQGEYAFAERELELALRLPDLTNYHSQRIRARLAELRRVALRQDGKANRGNRREEP